MSSELGAEFPATLAEMLDIFNPHPNSHAKKVARVEGVARGAEFVRIAALPRRQAPKDLTELLTKAYATPNGTMKFRPLQAYALTEVYDYRGLFGMMPVGSGKTLPSLLAARVLGAERPLLLVKANLYEKTVKHDIPFYRQHWKLPENLMVLSYDKLSRAPGEPEEEDDSGLPTGILWDRMPDFIAADEIQALRNPKAARTRRFLRYMTARPDTVLMALSGSMTRKSLRDYWHIIRLCLPRQCPLPMTWHTAEEWADAIDADVPEERRVAPGALLDFCEPGEPVRHGFRRRLLETPGVIGAMGESAFGDEDEPGIEIHEIVPPNPPPLIEEAFEMLRKTWTTPSGEEISDGMSLWRHAGSLAFGFFTRWVWPGNTPDIEWLKKRAEWKHFVRETLKHNRRGLDSEFQVWNACEVGDYDSPQWRAWRDIKPKYGPNGPKSEVVWVDKWLVKHAAKQDVNIIWTRAPGLGQAIAEEAGVPYFGAGNNGIIDYTGEKCVASIQSHGTGKNLQRWSKNLFVGPPYGASDWQQTMGRTHRPGQEADTVEYYVYLHCKELWQGFHRAIEEARYVEDTTLDQQKLLKATINLKHTPDIVAAFEDAGHQRWR